MSERTPDLRHFDPEVRKERVKLLASSLNAVGLALVIGGVVAPIVGPVRVYEPAVVILAPLAGLALIASAYYVLRFSKRQETADE